MSPATKERKLREVEDRLRSLGVTPQRDQQEALAAELAAREREQERLATLPPEKRRKAEERLKKTRKKEKKAEAAARRKEVEEKLATASKSFAGEKNPFYRTNWWRGCIYLPFGVGALFGGVGAVARLFDPRSKGVKHAGFGDLMAGIVATIPVVGWAPAADFRAKVNEYDAAQSKEMQGKYEKAKEPLVNELRKEEAALLGQPAKKRPVSEPGVDEAYPRGPEDFEPEPEMVELEPEVFEEEYNRTPTQPTKHTGKRQSQPQERTLTDLAAEQQRNFAYKYYAGGGELQSEQPF